MTVDTDYQQLLTLYGGIVGDMKQSYGAWDTVGQRANKLATTLRATSAALLSFLDAIQSVSDIANNLKGASRDVGACVTRVCMRERAVEARLRSTADTLSEHVAPTILQRISYWKNRTYDLEKNNAKQMKKSRTKNPDPSTIANQRNACARALSEQRQQFEFFVKAIMPFLTSQVSCIEEATHIISAVDGLSSQMVHTDPSQLVQTVLSDLVDGGDSKVSRVLEECHQQNSLRGGSEDPSPTWSAASDIASGSADSIDGGLGVSVGVPSTTTTPYYYVPSISSIDHVSHRSLSRKSSQHSIVSKNNSLFDAPVTFRQVNDSLKQRPQSFAGDLQQANGINQWQNGTSGPDTPYAASNYAPICHQNAHQSFVNAGVYMKNGSCSSSEAASTAFITETLQQIDQLGHELDNLCNQHDARLNGAPRPQSTQIPRPTHLPPPHAYNNSIRMRQSCNRSRPPPPERRGSQLSAGTPATPSVTRSSILGSQNSLNSSAMSTFDRSDFPVVTETTSSFHSKYTF
ncbi:unnamed protein product, partial [Mesorhabditis belari]|uniref:IMD domain-containing protein n=1 Tax=Mesorhabditis belari TaxID=2138241 RepID=A0AAF3F6E0_9BILA